MKETKIRYVIIMTTKLIKMTLESINILAHFHRQEKFAGTQFCCMKLISITIWNISFGGVQILQPAKVTFLILFCPFLCLTLLTCTIKVACRVQIGKKKKRILSK